MAHLFTVTCTVAEAAAEQWFTVPTWIPSFFNGTSLFLSPSGFEE